MLRTGGVLLVSVPYVSPLRRFSALWRNDRQFRSEARTEADGPGRSFWQYAFSVGEFSRLLREAGFRVDRTHPYAILFGLYDLPLMPRMLEQDTRATSPGRATAPAPQQIAPRPPATLLKRLLVSEDRSVAGLGLLVEVAGRLCANMMMYVCTPLKG